MRKSKLLLMSLLATAMFGSTAYAGQWQQDSAGWWYQNDNGSYPVNQWQEIDGKQYYFGANGYMLANTTTPDGYQVGADGAWVEEVPQVIAQTGDGTRQNPYNAYAGADFAYELTYLPEYNYTANLKLLEVVTGDKANEIVFSENMFNESETGTHKWRLYHFQLTCLTTNKYPVTGSVVSTSNFYNQDSTVSLASAENAILGDELKDRYDVKLYPGGTDDFWVGVLIDESIPYITFCVDTGEGEVWFTTKQ